ncbi:hypothetical protein ACEP2J_08710, partial [Pseudomonas aeruginosa]
KEQLVKAFVSTEAAHSTATSRSVKRYFRKFLFYSTACADLQTIFRSAGGAFYSVQIRCQAPR